MIEVYQRTVQQFLFRLVTKLTGVDKARSENYEMVVFPHRKYVQERESDVREKSMSPMPNMSIHQKWKCFLGKCTVCPTYAIPDKEKGTSNESPVIIFRTYKIMPKFTLHGF